MQQVKARNGIFAGGGDAYGGGVFNGNESGFGGLGATYEQAAAGIGVAEGIHYGPRRAYRDGSLGAAAAGPEQFPWGVYADSTKALQHDINNGLAFNGYCPIGEDGKLGPATCGASKLVLGGAPAECKSFGFTPSACGGGGLSTDTSKPYPWGVYSDNTVGLQMQLNNFLLARDTCPVGQDGKLGPETCGAAKWLTDQGVTQVGGYPKECKSFSFNPKSCPHTAGQPVPIAPSPTPPQIVPHPASCPDGEFMDPLTGACAPINTSGTSKSSMWLVGGLLVAAGLAGVALVANKKKHGRAA